VTVSERLLPVKWRRLLLLSEARKNSMISRDPFLERFTMNSSENLNDIIEL